MNTIRVPRPGARPSSRPQVRGQAGEVGRGVHRVLDRVEQDRAVELGDVDDPLHAQDVFSVPVEEHAEPDPEHGPVDGLVDLDAERSDVCGVVVRGGFARRREAAAGPGCDRRPSRCGAGDGFGAIGGRIGPGRGAQIRFPPTVQPEPALGLGLPGLRAVDILHEQGDRVRGGFRPGVSARVRVRGAGGDSDRSRGVDRPEPSLEDGGLLMVREIRLGQNEPVRERRLLHRLAIAAELGGAVDRVHHRHHRTRAIVVAKHRIGSQGMHDGSRVREPGRLDDHPIVGRRLAALAPPVEIEEGTSQVVPHRAAHAPVVEQHHAPGHRFEQVVIETHLPELVHEDRGGDEPRRGEEPAKERGLSAPEEPGHHVDRNEPAPVRPAHPSLSRALGPDASTQGPIPSQSNPAPPAATPCRLGHRLVRGVPRTAREAEHGGEHSPRDHLHPRRVRMDPVLLVERGHGGHPVQQERIEDRPVPGGELRIDRVEPGRVVRPEVGGSHHAGEEDGEAPLGEDAEQAVEVRPGHRRVDRAQPVVRPEGDDDRVRVVREGPFDPGEPAGRGIARHPRVDHPRVDPVRTKDGLQPGGERVA